MTTPKEGNRGLEMIGDLQSPSVEPGAAKDDPNPETAGERLERTSKSYYGKTVTEEDVRVAEKKVSIKQSRRGRRRSRTGGGQEEPGG